MAKQCRHFIFIVFLVLIAMMGTMFSNTVNAESAGLIVSLSGTALSNVANAAIPLALQQIKDIEIPSVSENDFTINTWINELTIENFSIGTNGQSLVINLSHLYIDIYSRWIYKVKHVPEVRGTVSARTDLSTSVGIRLVPGPERFQIQMDAVNVDLSEFRLTIHGKIVGKAINLLKNIFNGVIKRAAKSAIEPALRSALWSAVAGMADSIPAAMDTSLGRISFAPAAFGTSYANNNLALAFNAGFPGTATRHNIEDKFAPTGALFDLFVDTFVINSALATKTPPTVICTKDNTCNLPIPGWSGAAWKTLVPAIAEKYAKDDIQVHIGLAQIPEMNATPGILSAKAVLYFDVFTANTRLLRITGTGVMGAAVSIQGKPQDYSLLVQLQPPSLVWQTEESIIGPIDFAPLNDLLDFASGLATSLVNVMLADGIKIPSAAHIAITGADLQIFAGGFRIAGNIEYIP